MATIEIRRQLDFVNGGKGACRMIWQRLDGTDEIARVFWNNFLFARHQCDILRAGADNQFVEDFAGEKTQGQADNTALMAEHALNCQIGFPGIGGAKNRSYIAIVQARRCFRFCRTGGEDIIKGHARRFLSGRSNAQFRSDSDFDQTITAIGQ